MEKQWPCSTEKYAFVFSFTLPEHETLSLFETLEQSRRDSQHRHIRYRTKEKLSKQQQKQQLFSHIMLLYLQSGKQSKAVQQSILHAHARSREH